MYKRQLQSCERGYTWGPGVRDHYLIHYVVDGKGTYTVNNTVYELRAGDIFLAKPSQLITYSADKEEPWEYYWVGFNGACANKLVPVSYTHLHNAPARRLSAKKWIARSTARSPSFSRTPAISA